MQLRRAVGVFALTWVCTCGARAWSAAPGDSLAATPGVPARLDSAAAGAAAHLDAASARVLVDSLLRQVSRIRGLEAVRDVPVQVADRGTIRARLEEIT